MAKCNTSRKIKHKETCDYYDGILSALFEDEDHMLYFGVLFHSDKNGEHFCLVPVTSQRYKKMIADKISMRSLFLHAKQYYRSTIVDFNNYKNKLVRTYKKKCKKYFPDA